jgi:hypothetical protein
LQVTLAASDPDSPPAALTYQSEVFSSALDAQAFAVTQMLGLTEFGGSFYQGTFGSDVLWLKSSNGGNPNNQNWYNLFPDGTLRAWSGSTDPNMIASEGPVVATFSPAYFNSPNLLLNPQAVPGTTASVSGNKVTYSGFSAPGTYYAAALVTDGTPSASAFVVFAINVTA